MMLLRKQLLNSINENISFKLNFIAKLFLEEYKSIIFKNRIYSFIMQYMINNGV